MADPKFDHSTEFQKHFGSAPANPAADMRQAATDAQGTLKRIDDAVHYRAPAAKAPAASSKMMAGEGQIDLSKGIAKSLR